MASTYCGQEPKTIVTPQPVRPNKSQYDEHRKLVRNAKPEVDFVPPTIGLEGFYRASRLVKDADSYKLQTQENQLLLQSINSIMRTNGRVNTFGGKPPVVDVQSRIFEMRIRMKQIAKENLDMHNTITQVKSNLDTRWDKKKGPHAVAKKPKKRSEAKAADRRKKEVPTISKEKYMEVETMSLDRFTREILRPKIFIDLDIKNVRPLGRICIQLCTEAAPAVVYELVRLCVAKQKSGMAICHIFPKLWMEVDVAIKPDSPCTLPMAYDMGVLDHNACSGILSFHKQEVDGFNFGHLTFSISFRPLSVLNGQRVAFGHLIRGIKLVECLQDWGTINGKLKREVVVTQCGVMTD